MRDDTIPVPGAADRAVAYGDLTDDLLRTDWWTDAMLARADIPVVDIPFVSIGGGIGSFVTVDYLRICGVPPSAIRVFTQLDTPWESYEYLTRVSQIPRGERLRSDSASCPDNIWGFPSYALREAMATRSLKPLAHVLVEPLFDDYWTPKAGQAFDSMEQEYHRIRYPEMVVKGQVRMVRRRMGGGYFTILTPPAGATRTKRVAFRSRYVHVAVGYPGLKFLPDLMDYRETYRDFGSVVNAYEPHEQIYERLHRAPGTVLVRGGGIVASRVLQRLIDDRDARGLSTQILHVVPHVRRRPARPARLDAQARRRRLGLPGLQLPEVGVGRTAQGPHAQAGRPGPGRALPAVRRHQHPEAPGLAGPDAPRAAGGLVPGLPGRDRDDGARPATAPSRCS